MAKRTYASRDQAEAAKKKAARFVETVLHDPEHADAIREESLDDWMKTKGIRIVGKNPRRLSPHIRERAAREEVTVMARRETRADIEADRDALLDEVEKLRDLADDILSDYEPEEPESEEDESEEDDSKEEE